MGKPVLLVEALASRNDSGLGKHVRMFVEALGGLAGDADVRVILPRDGAWRPSWGARVILAEPRPLRPWIQAVFPWLILRHGARAVLCLGQSLPLLRPRAKYALLIPDAGPLERAPWAMSSHDDYNRRWLTANAQRADLILTSAAFTRDRLTSALALPEARIRIVRPISAAAGIALPKPAASAEARRAEPPQGGYFLSVGNVEPRKNYPGLLRAYARLRDRRPDAPPLRIVGHKAWGWPEAEAALARLGLGDSVRFTDFLAADDLDAWLKGCTAFISSSLYEGWGLPLFEALAEGKPSLYQRGSSQEEFARGLALAVDCADDERLAEGLEALMDAGERAKWTEAARAGFPRVMDYDLRAELRSALLPLLR
jgi:glycosyltransferase involved in cell wall biosynthesis